VMALWIAAYREAAYRPAGLGRGIKRWAARG